MAAKVRDEFEGKIPFDFSGMVRRRLRDEIVKLHLLERMVRDIKFLLADGEEQTEENAVYLWDNIKGEVKNGIQYRGKGDDDHDSDYDD